MVDVMERNVIEITKADLQRMRGSPPNDRRARFLKEKLSLKALSDERAQRWPNTIKALHEKRIRAKKEELEKLERERLELDASEAKLKAERRREMIERANKMLLLPHMTSLLFKRQRENTSKEREAQIQYKKHIQEGWKRQEEKWVHMQKEQLEKWDKQEEMKLQKQKEKVKALADARLSQAKKEEERQRLIKLDKEIEEFASKKEKMMDERKKLEAMKIAMKAQQRDIISEKLYKQLLATKVDDEMRLENEQNEKREFEDKREQMRMERNRKSWEECDNSRQMQIKCKRDQEMQDVANDKYEAERSWERAWQCKLEFEAAERERIFKNKAFAEHHKRTMGYNRMKEIETAKCEKDDERIALQRMEDEKMNGITLEDIKL